MKTAPFLPTATEWSAAGVVEGGLAFYVEVHLAPDHAHVPYQPVPFGRIRGDRHEVQGLGHTVFSEKAGEQHVCVRQVKLLAVEVLNRVQGKVSTLLVVQDGAENARGVEGRNAQPVYGAVGTDERRRVQVSYYSVIFYREITQSASSSHRMITVPILHPTPVRGKTLPWVPPQYRTTSMPPTRISNTPSTFNNESSAPAPNNPRRSSTRLITSCVPITSDSALATPPWVAATEMEPTITAPRTPESRAYPTA